MRARVTVTLKTGVLDPQGKAIGGALDALGIEGVRSVRQGKVFDLELAGMDPDAARSVLTRACERLLANTVVEDYRIAILDADSASRAGESAALAADMPAEGHP